MKISIFGFINVVIVARILIIYIPGGRPLAGHDGKCWTAKKNDCREQDFKVFVELQNFKKNFCPEYPEYYMGRLYIYVYVTANMDNQLV